MAWDALDLVFKKILGKRVTSDAKKFYEEFGDIALDISASEIKAQPIPFNDPTTGITNGVVLQYTNLVLTEDITVAGHQSWYAFTGGNRIKNWIPDKYGVLYPIKLYDNTGSQIFPTDGQGWIFDYVTGVLNFIGPITSPTPFKITGYTYIGTFMSGGGGSSLQSALIPITTNGQTSFTIPNHSSVFQVKVDGIPLRSGDYSILGNALTFNPIPAQFTLATSDELQVDYAP